MNKPRRTQDEALSVAYAIYEDCRNGLTEKQISERRGISARQVRRYKAKQKSETFQTLLAGKATIAAYGNE